MQRAVAVGLFLLLGTGAQAQTDPQSFDQIERGRYLAIAGDCMACHTVPGGAMYAGGRPIETPFGDLIAPNLTPDPQTGIGAMSNDDFVSSVKDGIGAVGHLYPAMPYTYYTRMTRADVLAIRAYLATLPPVKNDVHSNQLPFPFSIRASMLAWNMLFFEKGDFAPRPDKSAEWNRGAYLVEGPEHCGMCHTPKNLLGGDKTSQAYTGGVLQGWYAPNLTGDPRVGLGSWSEQDLVTYLRSGHNRFTAASGPMAEAVMDSTSQLTDADLKAMAVYIKDLPASGGEKPTPVAAQDAAMKAGQALYVDNCEACHARAGTGVPQMFPALKASALVQSASPASLIRVILEGSRSAATDQAPTAPAMPALGWKLNDDQVASIVTYIRNSWGNAAGPVSAGDVKDARGD